MKQIEDIIKIVKYLADPGLLLKGVCETIITEEKQQKSGFLSMLLGTLRASLLGNIIGEEGINRAGAGIIRDGFGSKESLIKKSSKDKKF